MIVTYFQVTIRPSCDWEVIAVVADDRWKGWNTPVAVRREQQK